MKVKDLLTELLKYPNNMEVCIADWRKNLHHADDEPQGNGIEPNFKIELIKEDINLQFVALSFENDDYKEDGQKVE